MKSKNLKTLLFKFPRVIGLISFMLSLILTQIITYRDYQLRLSAEKEDVFRETMVMEKKINHILSQVFAGTNSLRLFFEISNQYEQLPYFVEKILEKNNYIDALQIVEGGVISFVYPLEGNESVLGYNILEDPKTSKEAALAIEREEIYFAGPFELKQGGQGIIGRIPIYKNNQFWGFSAAILKLSTFEKLLEPKDTTDSRYYFQLSKINPQSGIKEHFLSEPIDIHKFSGFLHTSDIFEANWILTVQLKESTAFQHILLALVLRIFLSIILGYLAFYLAKQPQLLKNKVEKATKKWKKSNHRFKMATLATSDTIWDWSLRTGKVYRSENFEKLFGYPVNAFTNDTNFWNDHIHPEDLSRVLKKLSEVKNSDEKFWEQEFRFLKNNGEYADVIDKGIILRDQDGFPVRIIGATQDVTKTKNFERQIIKERDFLNSLLDNLKEGIISLDESSNIILTNKKARDILNLQKLNGSFESIIYNVVLLTPNELSPIPLKDNPFYIIKSGGKIQNLEIVIEKKEKKYHILVSGEPINYNQNQTSGAIIVLHDITDYVKKDEDIRQISLELVKRAEALELSNAELERFAYVTSHNLQEPLRMVISFLKLINTKYGVYFDEKGKSYLEFALEGADRMKQLIMDILEYSLADIGDEKSDIYLPEIIEDIKKLERTKILETNATITCLHSPYIKAVKTQLRQLIQNIVKNSLKFRKESVSPEIFIKVTEDDEFWLFEIKDNGIGIHDNARKKIFNLFEKQSTDSKDVGKGLGLAICKKIVSNHNGEIWIESNPDAGTIVYFTIEK